MYRETCMPLCVSGKRIVSANFVCKRLGFGVQYWFRWTPKGTKQKQLEPARRKQLAASYLCTFPQRRSLHSFSTPLCQGKEEILQVFRDHGLSHRNLQHCAFAEVYLPFLSKELLLAVGLSRIARGEVVSFCVPAVF